jgi:hypothetical protein
LIQGSINAMGIVNSNTIDQLPSQYADDPYFAAPYAKHTGSFRLKEGRLFKNQVQYVPRGPLGDNILQDHHDAAVSRHRGFAKTLSSIRHLHIWPRHFENMRRVIKVCRRVPTRQRLAETTSRTHPPRSTANKEMESDIYGFCV